MSRELQDTHSPKSISQLKCFASFSFWQNSMPLYISWRWLTILMQLFSSKVEEVSVAISWATISTAWFSRWYFLTKASLAKTAAPAPSDVGLVREDQHLIRDVSFTVQETEDRGLRLSPTLQQGEEFKHLPGVHHLLQTVLILELGIPVQAWTQRQLNHNQLQTNSWMTGGLVLLRVIGRMLVVFPGDFGKVFWFSAWKRSKHQHSEHSGMRRSRCYPLTHIRHVPYFSICSLPALPNICGAAGAAAIP